ncbi:MAG: hypothetical protein GTN74_09420 [Proteobacteria bacterium]|nr:hypothetical protein [Pseudomonadota bacterium]NIS70223.1 hypothetical protein [Pseudomonadota bacterium]
MKRTGWLAGVILLALASIAFASDLQFTEGNNFVENGSFMVMGFVKNTSDHTIKDITITVKYYDNSGNFLRFETTLAKPSLLNPGEEASYRVAIPEDKRIASIKKTARGTPRE